MADVEGARTFLTGGQAYDGFMGRYSRPLGPEFADLAGVHPGQAALDVGCGPGALTAVLAQRLGPASVAAVDPSPPFVAACSAALPGVDVRAGRAEELPHADAAFDVVLAQLVLHFVSDPDRAAAEFRRVLRPGGVAAACVWDFAAGMQMLSLFWESALVVDPRAPVEAQVMRFGREGELPALLTGAGFSDVTEATLEVSSAYRDFDELWAGFMAGIGPAGAYLLALDEERRAALRSDLFARLGSPSGGFTLAALARCASGRAPGR
jgi:ubiquinone/menaquinone biosynthesis C-methylase UbiE